MSKCCWKEASRGGRLNIRRRGVDPLGLRSPRRQEAAEIALLSTLPGRGRGTPAPGRREPVHSPPDTRLVWCGPTPQWKAIIGLLTRLEEPPLGTQIFPPPKMGSRCAYFSTEADAVPALWSTSSGVKLPECRRFRQGREGKPQSPLPKGLEESKIGTRGPQVWQLCERGDSNGGGGCDHRRTPVPLQWGTPVLPPGASAASALGFRRTGAS